MCELSQGKRIAVMATFESKSAKTSITASLAHGSEDGLLNGVTAARKCDGTESSGSDRVECVASAVSEVAIDSLASVEATIDHVGVILLVARDAVDEHFIVVAKRQSFGRAQVEKHVAIDIDDVAALRLLVVDESVHLGGFLVRASIIAPEQSLVPRASQVCSSRLRLDKSSASGEVVDRTRDKVKLAGQFPLDDSQHLDCSLYIYYKRLKPT